MWKRVNERNQKINALWPEKSCAEIGVVIGLHKNTVCLYSEKLGLKCDDERSEAQQCGCGRDWRKIAWGVYQDSKGEPDALSVASLAEYFGVSVSSMAAVVTLRKQPK